MKSLSCSHLTLNLHETFTAKIIKSAAKKKFWGSTKTAPMNLFQFLPQIQGNVGHNFRGQMLMGS